MIKNPISYQYYAKSKFDSMPFHSHSRYEIYYFHEGKGNYLIGDKIFTLKPGSLILMNGMTLHCPNIDKQHESYRTVLHFDPQFTKELLVPFQKIDVLKPFRELGNHVLLLTGDDKMEIEDIWLRMHCFFKQKNDISRSRFQLAFLDLLHSVYQLCDQALEQMVELRSGKEQLVYKIITYVEEHYQEDLHMEQLEKSLYTSKTYLSKVFKEVTGITPFKYIYQRRINQAKLYFLLENKSVTDACFRVGFKHLPHFSKLFKEIVGCTPEQFRKANIGKNK